MASQLEGVRVLDLSRILAGPYATQLLGDLGADVLKIERPLQSDLMRTYGPPFLRDRNGVESQESSYYLAANRNKRAATIDIAQERGQELIRQLAQRADVLVENFKTGDLAKFGLDYATISKVNPGIIYCSITGFGQTGPYRRRPAFDGTIQAMSGLMDQTGEPDGPPQRVGVLLVDMATAVYASSAILAALYKRDTKSDDKGEYIDISMLDVGVSMLCERGMNYLMTGQVPRRVGNASLSTMPAQTFSCADGTVFVSAASDDHFDRFCKFVIDRPDLLERFGKHDARLESRAELTTILSEIMAARPMGHWVKLCESHNIVCSPVNNVKQALEDPHVQHRGPTVGVEHALVDGLHILRNPVRFQQAPIETYRAPPVEGQHTCEALKEWLMLSDADLDSLAADGIIHDRSWPSPLTRHA